MCKLLVLTACIAFTITAIISVEYAFADKVSNPSGPSGTIGDKKEITPGKDGGLTISPIRRPMGPRPMGGMVSGGVSGPVSDQIRITDLYKDRGIRGVKEILPIRDVSRGGRLERPVGKPMPRPAPQPKPVPKPISPRPEPKPVPKPGPAPTPKPAGDSPAADIGAKGAGPVVDGPSKGIAETLESRRSAGDMQTVRVREMSEAKIGGPDGTQTQQRETDRVSASDEEQE